MKPVLLIFTESTPFSFTSKQPSGKFAESAAKSSTVRVEPDLRTCISGTVPPDGCALRYALTESASMRRVTPEGILKPKPPTPQ